MKQTTETARVPPEPLVTVLLPVFNGETHLAAAIDSVFAQTYANLELVVIDDGSTDSTAAIIAAYDDPRLIAARNSVNLGIVAALNQGLKLARGDLIARLDADDIADRRRLERQVDRFNRDPDIVALGTAIEYIDSAGRVMAVPRRLARRPAFLRWRLLRGTCLYHPTLMLHRGRAAADAYYSPEFAHAEDYELLLRLSERHVLDNLPEPLVSLRLHAGSVSMRFRDEQRASAARALIHHARKTYGIGIPPGAAQALIDPRHLFAGAADEDDSPVGTILDLERRFLSVETALAPEDHDAVIRDVAFFLWKIIAIAASDWQGGALLRLRLATIAACMSALLRRPVAAIEALKAPPAFESADRRHGMPGLEAR
jgi:glycosyltransferase involved in cell wall biosynthesis